MSETSPPTSPESLFRRWRDERDVDALAGAFDRTAPALLRLARHLAPAGVEAEDLVQTTFLFALERPEAWDAERPLAPWLAGVLGRRALEERRRGARSLEPERLRAPAAADPVEATLEGEALELVDDALARVPAPYRAVLEGRLVEQREVAEVARALGRGRSAVHSQTHRGLRLLRRALPAGLAPGAAGASGAGPELAAARRTLVREARRAAGAGALATGLLSSPALTVGIAATLVGLTLGAWLVGLGEAPPRRSLGPLDLELGGALPAPARAAGDERLALANSERTGATEAAAPPLVEGTEAEPEDPPDGESGLPRWWIVGRVLTPRTVDHGELAWKGTMVRVQGPGVGMEFGVVRADGQFRRPMLSPPPWEVADAQEDAEATPKRLTFTVRHPEFLPGKREVSFGDRFGDTVSVELELQPAGRVRGAATDGAGAKLVACFPQVYPRVGGALRPPAIADRGLDAPSSYDLLAAPGESVAVVGLGGLRPGSAPVVVLEGATHELPPVVLELGASVAGRVLGPIGPEALVEARLVGAGPGQPLGPLEVCWHAGRVEWSLVRASVRADGTFELGGLAPGERYRVRCGARDRVVVAGTVGLEL